MQVLHGHSLAELKVSGIDTNLEQIISDVVIGSNTKSSLKVLKISGCRVSPVSGERCLTMESMTRIAQTFRNLVSLSLVSIELQNDG